MAPEIDIQELLASPHIHAGHRLRVTGMYMYFHENQCLDGTPPDDADLEYDPDESFRIWLDTDGNTRWVGIVRRRGLHVRAVVEGLYVHGSCGHLGAYPGQLTEISSVIAVMN